MLFREDSFSYFFFKLRRKAFIIFKSKKIGDELVKGFALILLRKNHFASSQLTH